MNIDRVSIVGAGDDCQNCGDAEGLHTSRGCLMCDCPDSFLHENVFDSFYGEDD